MRAGFSVPPCIRTNPPVCGSAYIRFSFSEQPVWNVEVVRACSGKATARRGEVKARKEGEERYVCASEWKT